jgi:hypothetical protein
MIDVTITLPDWAVDNATAFRRAAARVTSFDYEDMDRRTASPRCVHGRNPFTDSCPNCDAEDEVDE